MRRAVFLIPALASACCLSACSSTDGLNKSPGPTAPLNATATSGSGSTTTTPTTPTNPTNPTTPPISSGPPTQVDGVTVSASTVMHGSTLTISGAGFGTKTNPAPFLWDDFETGTAGTPLASSGRWIHYENGSTTWPQYTNTQAYSGQRAAINDIRSLDANGANFNTAGIRGLQTTEAYFSYLFRWEIVSGDPGRAGFVKMLRANGIGGFYHSRPRFYTSLWPTASQIDSGYSYSGADADGVAYAGSNAPANTWNRMEVYYKLSSPAGTNTGALQTWANLVPTANLVNAMTLSSSQAGQIVDNFLLPFMVANANTALQIRLYVDDIYVDRTRARVEIGDAATWSGCRRREVQIPTSWSDTQITVSVNQGRFANGAAAYLYVVNRDGSVNARGVPLSFAP